MRESSTISRRALFAGAAAAPVAAVIPPTAAPTEADAELIRTCDRHIANHCAYNTYGGMPEDCESDPLWNAYIETVEALEEAEPLSIGGVIALARVAKVEATQPDGEELWDNGTECVLASKIVDALVRIGGAEHAPAG